MYGNVRIYMEIYTWEDRDITTDRYKNNGSLNCALSLSFFWTPNREAEFSDLKKALCLLRMIKKAKNPIFFNYIRTQNKAYHCANGSTKESPSVLTSRISRQTILRDVFLMQNTTARYSQFQIIPLRTFKGCSLWNAISQVFPHKNFHLNLCMRRLRDLDCTALLDNGCRGDVTLKLSGLVFLFILFRLFFQAPLSILVYFCMNGNGIYFAKISVITETFMYFINKAP